jgi:propionate CoA-transferase
MRSHSGFHPFHGNDPTMTQQDKFMDAQSAASLVPDRATVGLVGGGGGLLEADTVMGAIEARFLAGEGPRDLTLVHALGIGDRGERGLNRFAHEGMVRRVIGGHWVWSPRMQALAKDEKIEAYVLPGGVVMQQWREIGAKRPGLTTHVGLGTFIDPRFGGGRMNESAKDDLVELVSIDGREWLRYRPFPIDVAIIRGSFADPDGNISLAQEAATLDVYALAMAAHNCGGKVIAQVRHPVPRGGISANLVRVPGAIVDAVVVAPDQPLSHEVFHDPTLTGESWGEPPEVGDIELNVRTAIARRAAAELRDGAVINYGFGIPDAIAKIVAARGDSGRYRQTIEHGTYGGTLLDGTSFGYARHATAMIDAPSQFDFYSGGGLDIAFLGMGELDGEGSVNVSKLGGVTVGPGGFIDIAQNARKVVFCGTFEAKGVGLSIGDGRLVVDRPGEVQKLVSTVEQITFSGPQAVKSGQEVVYVTERAVFRLTPEGLVLSEVAPGVDVKGDVLDRMGFTPLIPETPRIMDAAHFTA